MVDNSDFIPTGTRAYKVSDIDLTLYAHYIHAFAVGNGTRIDPFDANINLGGFNDFVPMKKIDGGIKTFIEDNSDYRIETGNLHNYLVNHRYNFVNIVDLSENLEPNSGDFNEKNRI